MAKNSEFKYERGLKERIISLIVLVVLFMMVWYMLDVVLLTFILTFITYHLLKIIQETNRKFLPILIPDKLVLILIYVFSIMIFTIVSIMFAPKLAVQFTDLTNIFMNFDFKSVKDSLDPRLAGILSQIDFNKYIADAGLMLTSAVTTVGGFSINLFFSIIISFLLLLEKPKIQKFGSQLANSRISYIYDYLLIYGGNFVKTFGKVMKVQVLIAFINAIISMIFLAILSFPEIMSLGIMIFLLGLIPVAGVIVSIVPLSIIAFNIGGLTKVLEVLLMVIVIHFIEAYILNPKLMSDTTQLPICFVFIILLVAEHYLGVWGLLIGVPIFIFLLKVSDVDLTNINEKHGHT